MRYLPPHRSRSRNRQPNQFGFVSVELLVLGTTVALFALCVVLGIDASSLIDSIGS